jgi:DNA adenine methylase
MTSRSPVIQFMSGSPPPNLLKPILKWAGGKRWLLPRLSELWQSNRECRLVEPFMGSLSVALGLQPDRALLNDANIHLANFYHHLQQGLSVTIAGADGKPFEMKNDRDFYYEMRSRFNQLTREGQSQTSEAALIFYYLNRTAFNGLCRFNNSGGFNVPFGRYKTINYPTDFSAYQIPLQPWEITCGDFETLKLEPDDFIYADPPYDVQFTKYSQDDFTWEDQIRLTKWLAKHPGKVVLSNQATDRIVNLYEDSGFTIDRVDAPRRISCNGDRRPAKEVIAYKGF